MYSAQAAERVIDAAYVNARLDEAGSTLLALPGSGFSSRMSSGSMDVVRNAIEAYGWTDMPIKPPVPTGRKIDEMDEALAWLRLIPNSEVVLRRIVGAWMLVHPVTERRLFSLRRIAKSIGADYRCVQRWQARGVDRIVFGLHAQKYFTGDCSNGSEMCH